MSEVAGAGPANRRSEGRLGENGRYELVRPIGTGGFSTVFQAIDHRFEVPVAIKLLADNHARNMELRERFLSEANIQRRLAATGVVPVHDVGETDSGQPFVVMALASGDLLARAGRLHRERGRIGAEDVIPVIDALEAAVGVLHAHNIVHRDLKPGNLLLFGPAVDPPSTLVHPTESLLLADLGVAKQLELNSGLTAEVGTPGFRPPEQGQMNQIDHRADLFSATAVVYWLLTGHAPAQDPDVRSQQIQNQAIPAPLQPALRRGFAVRIDDRHPTVTEWAGEMRTGLAYPGSAATAGPSVGTGPIVTPGPLITPGADTEPVRVAGQSGPGTGSGPGRPSGLPMVLALALAAVAGTLGLAGGWLMGDVFGGDDDGIEVTTLDDGTAVREQSEAGVTVTVSGPGEAQVGETVAFTATVEGATDWSWVAPDGTVQAANDTLPVRLTNPGRGSVAVVATTPVGGVVATTAEFTVTE